MSRHSERSEESLFGLSPITAKKEGFLASLGMTEFIFFAACSACLFLTFAALAEIKRRQAEACPTLRQFALTA
jgi:hypothetical protein